jgi:hypothetical protein
MATGKTVHYREGQPSRWRRILFSIVLLVLAGSLAFALSRYRTEARYEAARAAQLTCVCRYVSQLPLGTCEERVGTGSLSIAENPDEQSVTAGYPLMPDQTARYLKGPGCRLEPWKD